MSESTETLNGVPYHVAETKQWRKDLDVVLQNVKRGADKNYRGERPPDHPVRTSRERATCITKIQEAIMWLGLDLKEQNEANPYPQSYNPDSAVIAPTADGLKL